MKTKMSINTVGMVAGAFVLVALLHFGVVDPSVAPYAMMGLGVLYQTDYAKGTKILPAPKGSETVIARIEFVQSVALALNDIVELCQLPEDCVPTDAWMDSDRLDSNGAPTITISLGILNAAKSDIDNAASGGAAWILASTFAQTATNLIARMTTAHGARQQPRPGGAGRPSIGLKCAAAPATGVAALTNLNVNRGKWQPGVAYTANDFITLANGVRQKCTTTGVSGLTLPQFAALYNTTTADGTAVWTTADPVIGVSFEYRAAHFGT